MGEMNDAQLLAWCEWLVETLGGPGTQIHCSNKSVQILTPQQCLENTQLDGLPGNMEACTVSAFEDWVATTDECGLFAGLPPCGQ
jgi:hypothetical protein